MPSKTEFITPPVTRLNAIIAGLATPPPAEMLSKREGPGGREFTYVTGAYVIKRANELFGPDGWTLETLGVEAADGGYMARVRVNTNVEGFNATQSGIGFTEGKGETAIKGAETDAMKRALMKMGSTFGLDLYPVTNDGTGSGGGADRPASEKQTAFIERLGGTAIEGMTSAQATKMIDQLKSDEASTAASRRSLDIQGPAAAIGAKPARPASDRQMAAIAAMFSKLVAKDEDAAADFIAEGTVVRFTSNPDEAPFLALTEGFTSMNASATIQALQIALEAAA